MTTGDEENAEVLQRMRNNGDDLAKPRKIDFTVVFTSEEQAEAFASRFSALGYATSVEFAEVSGGFPWDVRVVRTMVPALQSLGEFERLLESIAEEYGGYNDGWGCFAAPF